MWVSESLTPQALKIINDMASELNLSYVVFEAEYATFKFLLPSKYLIRIFISIPIKPAISGRFQNGCARINRAGFARILLKKACGLSATKNTTNGLKCSTVLRDVQFFFLTKSAQEMVFAIQNGYHKN